MEADVELVLGAIFRQGSVPPPLWLFKREDARVSIILDNRISLLRDELFAAF